MKSFVAFAAILAVALAAPQHRQQVQRQQRQQPVQRQQVQIVQQAPVQVVQQQQHVPVGGGSEVVVLKESLHDNIGVGGYQYSYELSDGQARQESAELINEGTENVALRITGSFSWVDAEGQVYTVNYVADENGFQPQGAHLPAV